MAADDRAILSGPGRISCGAFLKRGSGLTGIPRDGSFGWRDRGARFRLLRCPPGGFWRCHVAILHAPGGRRLGRRAGNVPDPAEFQGGERRRFRPYAAVFAEARRSGRRPGAAMAEPNSLLRDGHDDTRSRPGLSRRNPGSVECGPTPCAAGRIGADRALRAASSTMAASPGARVSGRQAVRRHRREPPSASFRTKAETTRRSCPSACASRQRLTCASALAAMWRRGPALSTVSACGCRELRA